MGHLASQLHHKMWVRACLTQKGLTKADETEHGFGEENSFDEYSFAGRV